MSLGKVVLRPTWQAGDSLDASNLVHPNHPLIWLSYITPHQRTLLCIGFQCLLSPSLPSPCNYTRADRFGEFCLFSYCYCQFWRWFRLCGTPTHVCAVNQLAVVTMIPLTVQEPLCEQGCCGATPQSYRQCGCPGWHQWGGHWWWPC